MSVENKLEECKVICLCGSTRFKKEFEEVNRALTLQGHIILAPGVFGHADKIMITEQQKKDLDKLHFEKIDISGCIYIVHREGYIGSSTKAEIEYAKNNGKPIFYMK